MKKLRTKKIGLTMMIFALAAGCDDRTPEEQTGDHNEHANQSGPDSNLPIKFTDITDVSGVDMNLMSGATPATQILEVKGGGLALFDYDNDGDLDLLVPNGATLQDTERGTGARLFQNQGDATFLDVTETAGIQHQRWSMGVAVGDVNADGFDDVFICCFGADVLLINNGDGSFATAGDDAVPTTDNWSAAATFGDVDNDGDLDLYVVRYLEFDPENPPPAAQHKGQKVFGGPAGCPPLHDALLINDGRGNFTDETQARGALCTAAYGLNAIMLDVDADGWLDILVGNDSMPNEFLHNRGDGSFDQRGMTSGFATNTDGHAQATMGMAVADVDGNGFPDVYSTNFANDTNTLLLNRDGTWFEDGTRRFGFGLLTRPYLGWACAFFDVDHDGDEDLLTFNGHVYAIASWETMDSPFLQEPLMFERDGDRFARNKTSGALSEAHCDRAAAFGDLDGDGDIDAVVGELNGPIRILRNDSTSSSNENWITIAVQNGLGARVSVAENSHIHHRWIISGGSFQSASSTDAHFAFASHDLRDVSVTIRWADGYEKTVNGLRTGRRHTVKRTDS